jgi:peptidoglycan hydrolase-like protein with peptidoglycan-binding domain
MFDIRCRLPYAAVLLGVAIPFAFPPLVLAQSATTPHVTVSTLQVAQASGTVLEIQRELNLLGYDAGPVNGFVGERTRSAIQAYQRDHNLLVDGRPTSNLLSHVRATAQSRSPGPGSSRVDISSQQIADIQAALRSLDYEVGYPSGRLDNETRAAIRSYESDHGLLMSGEPSAELLRHMRERVAAAPTSVDANTVARIQAQLRLRGYPIPLVSGRMDAPTRQAIREYQQGQGVPVTGEPSQALLDELHSASAEPVPDVVLSREQRAAAQRALNARGYDVGPADGVLGPRSRGAIHRFQAANNLNPTGELDPLTMERLGVPVAVAEPPAAVRQRFRVRVRDDFADGDYTRDPVWTIASGHLEVRNGGLNSVVPPASERPEDVGRQMLGELLKRQFNVDIGGQEVVAAVAYLPIGIAPAFRITMNISGSAEAHSHIDLGLYRGERLNHGYRLDYRSGEPLRLVFVDERGAAVVASAGLRVDRGVPQQLIWQRNLDGQMTVTRDEEILIDLVDQDLTNSFDGFSLINAGGEWTLHEVIIEDHRQRESRSQTRR